MNKLELSHSGLRICPEWHTYIARKIPIAITIDGKTVRSETTSTQVGAYTARETTTIEHEHDAIPVMYAKRRCLCDHLHQLQDLLQADAGSREYRWIAMIHSANVTSRHSSGSVAAVGAKRS